MRSKVAVHATIRVDGQAYASADAMPPATRRVYDRALAAIDGGTYSGPLTILTTGVKGDRRTSAHTNQALPLDDEAIRSILAVDTPRSESTAWRVVIAGIVVGAMLLAAFVFGW